MKRTRLLTGLCAIGAGIAGWFFWPSHPQPIEGVWRNDYYGACLCPSDSFFLFHDGKIDLYSDLHFTSYDEGRYENLGDGRYRVVLFNERDEDFEWVVRPGEHSWRHPPDSNIGFWRRRARLFYRTENKSGDLDLIATAVERDARIQGRIDEDRAQQGEH